MKLLTEAEAAAELRCSRETVRRLRRAGKLAATKGRPVRLKASDVDAYAQSLFRGPTPPTNGQKPDTEVVALARRIALKRRLARKV